MSNKRQLPTNSDIGNCPHCQKEFRSLLQHFNKSAVCGPLQYGTTSRSIKHRTALHEDDIPNTSSPFGGGSDDQAKSVDYLDLSKAAVGTCHMESRNATVPSTILIAFGSNAPDTDQIDDVSSALSHDLSDKEHNEILPIGSLYSGCNGSSFLSSVAVFGIENNDSFAVDDLSTEELYPVLQISDLQGTCRYIHEHQDSSYVRILDLLQQFNTPLYAFDSLMKLLREETLTGRLDINQIHPSRETFMKKLVKMFGGDEQPQKIDVLLETDAGLDGSFTRGPRDVSSVFVFDAEEQIKSLLNDMELFSDIDNLVVDPENPFGRYISPDGRLGEVYSGNWYDHAYTELIDKNPSPNGSPPKFFLGINLYLDKTGTSINQRHGLEPCMITALIIKERVRNQCYRCHRQLGYIPDLDQRSHAQKQAGRKPANSGRACRNYHKCLRRILEPLERVMSNGIDTYVTIGKETRHVLVIVAVAIIMGDGKSGDTLCCRTPHYRQARTCRGCYTPFLQLSLPREPINCNWVLQMDQRILTNDCEDPGKEDDVILRENLKAVSTIRCDSIMFDLNYGRHQWGQFFACTVDLMHAFESGVVVHVIKAFVSGMSTKTQGKVDDMVDHMFGKHRSSEKDTFPRTNFAKGCTNMKLLQAFEWPGLLVVYLVMSQTYRGRSILKYRFDDKDARYKIRVQQWKAKLAKKAERTALLRGGGHHAGFAEVGTAAVTASEDEDEEEDLTMEDTQDVEQLPRCTVNKFVCLMDQLLTFHAYYKQMFFWKKGDRGAEIHLHEALMTTLQCLTSTLVRQNGSGWNLQKVHEVFFHLTRQIAELGRPNNTDCQVGERGLKVWGKHDANQTNKGSVSQFTEQVCKRVCENRTLSRAQMAMDIQSKKTSLEGVRKDYIEPNCDNPMCPDGMVGLPKYKVHMKEIGSVDGLLTYTMSCDWKHNKERTSHLAIPETILNLFKEAYFTEQDNDDEPSNSLEDMLAYSERMKCSIHGYTEYMRNGKRYRAHPNHNDAGQWYDWAVITDPNYETTMSEKHPKNPNSSEALFESQSTLDEWYGEDGHYVPARIVALYKHPDNGEDWAVVHPCRQRQNKNDERSSIITESWHLASIRVNVTITNDNNKQTTGQRQLPMYNLIRGTDIVDRVRVYMEDYRIQEDWPCDPSSGHVILLTSRSNRWATDYLDHRTQEDIDHTWQQ